MIVDIELGTGSFVLSTSPSTIVSIFGIASSLDPFLKWVSGDQKLRDEERARLEAKKKLDEEQHARFQRDVLRKIFLEIDVDGSGSLSEDELRRVVVMLLDKYNTRGSGGGCIADQPTMEEIKRETDYLLTIMDQNRSNEITFQELDNAFFRLVNAIDDNNLIPTIRDDIDCFNEHWTFIDSFLSGPSMRKLIYFDDLREFSSLSEVYRITGEGSLENTSYFPAPSLWRQGEGIELFWELYTSSTGCSRNSLNGQNIASVQRKLVRSLG